MVLMETVPVLERRTLIIDHLVINNFKNYPGVNEFSWSIRPEKNVILIGGMNGAGKTTISEAIKLCLYGQKLNGSPLSELKYQDYLAEVFAKKHDSNTLQISINVILDHDNPPMLMTITRTFVKSKDKFKESLSLTKDGKDVELIDKNYWEYYISKILPSQLSRYFFFDGERVRDTIASSESSDYLYGAIRDLAGISKFDILKSDLQEIKKRISRANMKPSITKRIKTLEERIGGFESDIRGLKDKISILYSEKTECLVQKDHLESEINRATGIRNQRMSDLKKEVDSARARLTELNDYVYDFAYSNIHCLICSNLIEDVLAVARIENDNNVSSMLSDYLQLKISDIKHQLMILNIDREISNKLISIIMSTFSDISKENECLQPIIDLTYRQIESLSSFDIEDSDCLIFINRLREREELSIKISKIDKELNKHSDEQFDFLGSKLEEVQFVINDLDQKIYDSRIATQVKQGEIEKLREEITAEERSLVVSSRDSVALMAIESSMKNLDIRTQIRMNDCVQQLEIDINKMYKLLKNKDDMVKIVKILPDYSLKLVGFDNDDVPIPRISEGEKMILMYSVMYGLLNISESKLPLIIDSPMGRMDSKHVSNLVKHLYPVIGNQVIILSHDREITASTVPLLDSVVSHKYLLTREIPKIREGYFE